LKKRLIALLTFIAVVSGLLTVGAPAAFACTSGVDCLHDKANFFDWTYSTSTHSIILSNWYRDHNAWEQRARDAKAEINAATTSNFNYSVESTYAGSSSDWESENLCAQNWSNWGGAQVVVVHDGDWSGNGNTYAYTVTGTCSGTRRAMVIVNGDLSFQNWNTQSTQGGAGTSDLQGILTHELLHAMGWSPSHYSPYNWVCDNFASTDLPTMCPSFSTSETYWIRSLEHNDIQEIAEAGY